MQKEQTDKPLTAVRLSKPLGTHKVLAELQEVMRQDKSLLPVTYSKAVHIAITNELERRKNGGTDATNQLDD